MSDTADNPEWEGLWLELELPSRVELVTVVRLVVAAGARAAGALEGARLDDLRWVVSESVTNAMNANLSGGDHSSRVRLRAWFRSGAVHLEVSDQGPGFRESPAVPDMAAPERLSIEGGFGIPLMQALASEPLRFHSTNEGTTLVVSLQQSSTSDGGGPAR